MIIIDDAKYHNDHLEDAMGEYVHGGNAERDSSGRRAQITPLNMAETMRSFNERMTKVHEEKDQINVSILQILIDL